MRPLRWLVEGAAAFFLFSLAILSVETVVVSSPGWSAEAEKKDEKKEAAEPKESFNLILPFQDLTVGQGQEVTMDAEVVNRTKNPVQVSLNLESVPKGWEVGFHSRYPSYPVRSVMVQGEKSTTIEFKAKVPEKTKAGDYEVKVLAKDDSGKTTQAETVKFRVTSKKVETGGLKLTTQYSGLSTPTGQTLKFTVDLKNETNKPLTASLSAQAPNGWFVRFKPQFGDTLISSIALKENATETLSVEIDSPIQEKAGEYPVTVRARSGAFEASTNLTVTLKGTYDLKIGTASGTLNTSITAGRKTPIDFLVGNAGTAPIRNLSFVTKKPAETWTIDFRPDKIDVLNPGEVREIKMEIMAPERTIAGDYLVTLSPSSPDINKSVEFRVTVSTPTLWGWIGAGVVGAVALGLGLVFVRLGRR
ncbi:MAG TPA: NEW3 domain-containing protein [Candidatus Acidoferrales bacterium]|nr:NEW3 domain-containing protein [Candidatus Acidoferrales bacterium]